MTMDKRLEKLAERHEALAQAMDLNASLQRGHDQRTRQAIDTLVSLHADMSRAMENLIGSQRGMMDAITRLDTREGRR
jgi:hypothetical protein